VLIQVAMLRSPRPGEILRWPGGDGMNAMLTLAQAADPCSTSHVFLGIGGHITNVDVEVALQGSPTPPWMRCWDLLC